MYNPQPTRFYLNGKFIAQPTTGVQRVAAQHLQALDAMGPDLPGRWTLLCPAEADLPHLRYIAVRVIGRRRWPLHFWEQVLLPWAARDGLLVNLAGAAPWAGRLQACMVHDAAVYDHPEAYAPAFVAWYRFLFARLARRARPLLTVSAFSRQRLAQRLAVPPRRFAVIPHGADHLDAVEPDQSTLSRHGLEGKRFLLAVASDNPTKNLTALVAAYAQLGAPDGLRLVLVGGRNQRVFAGGPAAPDPPGVLRTGPLHDPALKALYQNALALVVPSLYEGFGLPTLEAMACGCPVLAARAAALPEVCGDAALYFDPHTPTAIAIALRAVLDDEDLRARLRSAGTSRAAAFRWQTSAGLLLQALQNPPT